MSQEMKKYPLGIQTFSRIIREGYVYVDKTDIIWQLVHYARFVFLSRPRRFGKSLLSSTLESYFLGDRQLFQGLKIMTLEKEWLSFPVIHLDLSIAKGQDTVQSLRETLMWMMKPLREIYGSDEDETSPGKMLMGIIRRASRQTGKQVVVIIDEYDAPLLDVLHDNATLDGMRMVMQEFFQPLKVCEPFIQFCFITGITKFSQLSIFSTINNIKNVSLNDPFSSLCGFTEEEVKHYFAAEIGLMAHHYGMEAHKMYNRIKAYYDGYHFSAHSPAVFNPYSLLNAFQDGELNNYWFTSGTPTFLIRQMQRFHTDITSLDHLEVPSSAFDQPTENMQDALPLLYQTGYLTIKAYDREGEVYTLSIPNQEVRIGYTEGLLPAYTGLRSSDVQVGFALKFWRALKSDNIDLAIRHLQAYLAGIPYVEGFKQKLADAAASEGFYEYTLYLIFSMLNVYVRTQVKVAGGRIDVIVFSTDMIYVMELKAGGSAEEALQQIEKKGYAKPYLTDGRPVVLVGINMDKDRRTVESWKIKEIKS